jgi:PTS system nitrogen regulatory IIA component
VEWARSHNLTVCEKDRDDEEKKKEDKKISLNNAILRGGVFYDLEGDDIFTVLQNAVATIQFPVEVEVNKDLLLDQILFRESVASTGIGKGVAIPHLRDVQHLKLEYPIIPVFFLRNEIDFNSIDGQPVFVLFFIFTPAPEIHLKMLSRLSYCLHNAEFISMLKNGVDEKQLLEKIEALEEAIDNN